MSFEKAYEEVKTLVRDFKANEKFYLSKEYQEAEARKDFIDKFFTALGWDVHHDTQKDPYEQEVKVERSVNVSGVQKKADYSFSLAPNFRDPKFFVEAKKPAQSLNDADFYFQTIRYGWHKDTPFAVLTDFKEFHILDSRFAPDINTALQQQYKAFHYSDYLNKEKFAEIYWLFSREAVAADAIEKRAKEMPKPRGKATRKTLSAVEKYQKIDDAFLAEIDTMREKLAKTFKKNDKALGSDLLTEATQKTIDRLVFIRFLEDKLIEQEHYVSTFGENGACWKDFISTCRKLDAKYNGIVFKKSLIDDENVFKGPVDAEFHAICQHICHLNSRFLFNEIPIHILGSIYERFLGKVVHATAKEVKVEPKHEVRKAGGVYYTPKYIVNYIIRKTVGRLIEGKTPEQISRMRFADIACGSGSFLIGIFDYILDYHNRYYQKNPAKAKKDGCHYKNGLWVLSIKQKQKILVNNVFGIDIDRQATEVSQLSLSLKLLEDETTATANEMQVLFHEKILPNMSKNIVCGNSLVSTNMENTALSDEEELRINAFNFNTFFPAVMNDGGFDAITGNPPYEVLLGKDDKEANKKELERLSAYIKANYHFVEGEINLYKVFTEQALKNLLKPKGYFGYIMPTSFLNDKSTKKLRTYALQKFRGLEICEFPEKAKVFKDVTQGVCIYIFSNRQKEILIKSGVLDEADLLSKKAVAIDKKTLTALGKIPLFRSADEYNVVKQLNAFPTFREAAPVQFIEGEIHLTKFRDALLDEATPFSAPLVRGDVVKRYALLAESKKHAFVDKNRVREISSSPKLRDVHANRIVYQQVVNIQKSRRLNFAPVEKGTFVGNTCGYLKTDNQSGYHENYFLAILNSSLLNWRYKLTSSNNHILTNELFDLPFREINFSDKPDRLIHDTLVSLVNELLAAQKKRRATKTEKEIEFITRKTDTLDYEIDTLVFQLYGIKRTSIVSAE